MTHSRDLPGGLPPEAQPSANTRLLSQFPPAALEGVAAWYWGHEHSSAVFQPYAGLRRGRLIGNGCIPQAKDYDIYQANKVTNSTHWGGPPRIVPNSKVDTGDDFWGLGFVTISLDGQAGHAKHFSVVDRRADDGTINWKLGRMYYAEDL